MKYGGSISIVDDEGNLVFERELSDDEIVEAILAAVPGEDGEPAQIAEDADAPEVTQATKSKRSCGVCGKPGHNAKTCKSVEDTATWKERKAAEKRAKIEQAVENLVEAGFPFDEIALQFPNIGQRELEEIIAYAERSLALDT